MIQYRNSLIKHSKQLVKQVVLSLLLFITYTLSFNAYADELCSGEDFVQQMGALGFRSMNFSSSVYSEQNIHSLSQESAEKHNKPYEIFKIEYSKIRTYRLSNFDDIFYKLAELERYNGSKNYQESLFQAAMKKSINATIYEYETEQDASKALALLGSSSDYNAAIGNYYIFSLKRNFKVKELTKYISYCTVPLHQIFRTSVSPGNAIALPNGWGKYNKYNNETSDVDIRKGWLTKEKDPSLIQAIRGFDTARAIRLIQEGKDLNARTLDTQRTALHQVLFQDNVERIDTLAPLLINAGIDCNTQDKYGVTPLMLAAQHSLKLTQDLIACGADPQLKTKSNETAVDYAKDANMKDVMNYLQSLSQGFQ